MQHNVFHVIIRNQSSDTLLFLDMVTAYTLFGIKLATMDLKVGKLLQHDCGINTSLTMEIFLRVAKTYVFSLCFIHYLHELSDVTITQHYGRALF